MKTLTKKTNGRLADIPEAPAKLPPKQAESIHLKPIQVKLFEVRVVGISPLIVHRFSEKALKQIADKQQGKAAEPKGPKDPNAEYLASLHVMPDSGPAGDSMARYGFPAAGFKSAAVDACSFIDGITKVEARGAFHVLADAGGLVELKYASLRMREDFVRLNGQTADLRYRGEFDGWECTLKIRYNAAVITPERIINLLNVGGFSIGVGEWRPQRDGSNGMFEVPGT